MPLIFGKYAREICEDPDSLSLLPNPCDTLVPKREWERCLLVLRGVWRGDAISPVILLRRYSENLVHFGCPRELWQTCRVLRRRSEFLGLFVRDVSDDVAGGSSMNQEIPAAVNPGNEQLEPEVKAEPEGEVAEEEKHERRRP